MEEQSPTTPLNEFDEVGVAYNSATLVLGPIRVQSHHT